MAAAALRQAFLQADQDAARQAWRQLAGQLRPRWPKPAGLMDGSGHGPALRLGRGALACMGFPAQHRARPPSTNPPERLGKEVKRRAGACPPAGKPDRGVAGILPGEASITRLAGAVPLEASPPVKPEGRLWQPQHRCMQAEAMAGLPAPEPQTLRLPPLAAWPDGHLRCRSNVHHLDGRDPGSDSRVRGIA